MYAALRISLNGTPETLLNVAYFVDDQGTKSEFIKKGDSTISDRRIIDVASD